MDIKYIIAIIVVGAILIGCIKIWINAIASMIEMLIDFVSAMITDELFRRKVFGNVIVIIAIVATFLLMPKITDFLVDGLEDGVNNLEDRVSKLHYPYETESTEFIEK